ncbi:hypothetical protein FACS1894167_06420 [Synergistales bacterium]|nr:hypothetical protein FACS1894167_06420 [Synergistales bacterium]
MAVLIIVCNFVLFGDFPASAAAQLGAQTSGELFERSFAGGDFMTNRDATKYEQPENGLYRITPRAKNISLWTRFALPDEVSRYKDWTVTASVNSAEGTGAGAAIIYGDNSYVLLIFPDGRGSLKYYEGKKETWKADFSVRNFAFPVRLSISRDANGSVIGSVNGIFATSLISEPDLKKTGLPAVTGAAFFTQSPGNTSGSGALYERLDVTARGSSQLF